MPKANSAQYTETQCDTIPHITFDSVTSVGYTVSLSSSVGPCSEACLDLHLLMATAHCKEAAEICCHHGSGLEAILVQGTS